jgi:EmrB/QacA subfamily drug resistance transporter
MIQNKYKLLFMFGLCGFLTPFIGSAVNLSLPIIGQELGINIVALGWVVTIFLMSSTVFLIPFGRLADILGRRKIFVIGLLIFTLSSLFCSFANSIVLLLVARACQGLGSAMIFGTSPAILVSIFPQNERGKALSVNAAGVYIGMSIGASVGGFITQYFGWRYVFVLTTLIGATVLVMTLRYIHDECTHAKGESFDIVGSILYGISIVSMLYGTTLLPAARGYIVIIAGVLMMVGFCVFEDKVKHPIFDIGCLTKNRKFAMANLAALLNFSAVAGFPFLMGLYLQYAKGLKPNMAGLILLSAAVVTAVVAPIAGKLSDKKDQRIIASIGMLILAFAFLTLSLILHEQTSMYFIVPLFCLLGLGSSLFGTPNTHSAMEAVLPRHLGLASSLLATVRVFGGTMSMGIAMLVLSLIVGKVTISNALIPQLIQCIRVCLFVFGVLCIMGMFASMARGKKREEKI